MHTRASGGLAQESRIKSKSIGIRTRARRVRIVPKVSNLQPSRYSFWGGVPPPPSKTNKQVSRQVSKVKSSTYQLLSCSPFLSSSAWWFLSVHSASPSGGMTCRGESVLNMMQVPVRGVTRSQEERKRNERKDDGKKEGKNTVRSIRRGKSRLPA